MLEFIKKLSLDFLYITLSAIITLFTCTLLKVLIALVLKPFIESLIVEIFISLFPLLLFSLMLVSIKHHLKYNSRKKSTKNFPSKQYKGIVSDFVVLLRDGEYITVVLLIIISAIYNFVDFELLVIYSSLFEINILESKALSSFLSISIILIVYYAYLLIYRRGIYKNQK